MICPVCEGTGVVPEQTPLAVMPHAVHQWRQELHTKFGPPVVLPVVRLSTDNHEAPAARYKQPEIATVLLRSAFERSGLSKGELAERMGWMRTNIDTLNRTLGYRPDSGHHGVRILVRSRISYDLAVRLCRAIGASPFDCGV